MKKGVKIFLSILGGFAVVTAICGALYGFDKRVHDWFTGSSAESHTSYSYPDPDQPGSSSSASSSTSEPNSSSEPVSSSSALPARTMVATSENLVIDFTTSYSSTTFQVYCEPYEVYQFDTFGVKERSSEDVDVGGSFPASGLKGKGDISVYLSSSARSTGSFVIYCEQDPTIKKTITVDGTNHTYRANLASWNLYNSSNVRVGGVKNTDTYVSNYVYNSGPNVTCGVKTISNVQLATDPTVAPTLKNKLSLTMSGAIDFDLVFKYSFTMTYLHIPDINDMGQENFIDNEHSTWTPSKMTVTMADTPDSNYDYLVTVRFNIVAADFSENRTLTLDILNRYYAFTLGPYVAA
jgi:hypothetical protein